MCAKYFLFLKEFKKHFNKVHGNKYRTRTLKVDGPLTMIPDDIKAEGAYNIEILKGVKSRDDIEEYKYNKPSPVTICKSIPSNIMHNMKTLSSKTESKCSFCNMVFYDFR